jgi:hypothetical protein
MYLYLYFNYVTQVSDVAHGPLVFLSVNRYLFDTQYIVLPYQLQIKLDFCFGAMIFHNLVMALTRPSNGRWT